MKINLNDNIIFELTTYGKEKLIEYADDYIENSDIKDKVTKEFIRCEILKWLKIGKHETQIHNFFSIFGRFLYCGMDTIIKNNELEFKK